MNSDVLRLELENNIMIRTVISSNLHILAA